ncbi:RagB/SusD family nutrient uptake outer membrane protein [Fulvivirgaceae bacterium BMA12]|uniref:RagB/SusD family nutrient uptake outer membrane protein n=1 Tax=Agaribacillus aureus TaxID=3051825 RepID=A0ABT8LJ66_9BACT|nr:RagB/SusD family nutrient uptake outer membrane protein [Fulvivirgaceae bacterium BMA12]
MKLYKNILVIVLVLSSLTACEIGDQVDPNSPSLTGLLENANSAQLNNLVFGTLSEMRTDLPIYFDNVGILGREHYRFSGSDPRFISDLLGQSGGPLDNNAFYTTRNYYGRYRAIKNANILIEAVNTTNADITDESKNGYLGFARTIIAHELLMNLNVQDENGIRTDVSDPDDLGPFVSKAEAFSFIADLLNEASNNLNASGDAFLFNLSSGFTNFTTPQTFREFNRGLAARVALYRGNYSEALTLLADSFLDLNGDFNNGVFYSFSTSTGDVLNQLFIGLNASGDIRAAREEWVDEAELGDTRLSKASLRDIDNPEIGPATQSGLSSNYDLNVFQSQTDPVTLMRNEELILIYAEANIQENQLTEAVNTLDIIRNAHGLADYAGTVDQASLINEMLKQRRYSLYFEGHRWIDLRRYDRLDELPLDRVGDIVHERFPRPFPEVGRQGG